jgi:hypothetical protein
VAANVRTNSKHGCGCSHCADAWFDVNSGLVAYVTWTTLKLLANKLLSRTAGIAVHKLGPDEYSRPYNLQIKRHLDESDDLWSRRNQSIGQ